MLIPVRTCRVETVLYLGMMNCVEQAQIIKEWLCTLFRVSAFKGYVTNMTGIKPRHRPHHLSLLPSGSDEVHDCLLQGGRSG